MGLHRMGPPAEFITRLQAEFKIENFIETGTYYGNTAEWASHHFDRVFTIEYSEDIYQIASNRFDKSSNVHLIFGDSRREIGQLINQIVAPSLFWLDAHWSGGLTYGNNDECPLLEELHLINRSDLEHFILIDDARLFTSPPPLPHHPEQWPDLTAVVNVLQSGRSRRYIVIIEDVIIAVPEFAKPVTMGYCQEANTRSWKNYVEEKVGSGGSLSLGSHLRKLPGFVSKVESKLLN